MILILGEPGEPHVKAVKDALAALGREVTVLDTRLFPKQYQISFRAEDPAASTIQAGPAGPVFAFREVEAVYWRTFKGIQPASRPPPEMTSFVFQELESALRSAISALCGLDARWVNPPQAIESHRTKPYQTTLMAAHGFATPSTLVTNDPARARCFYDELLAAGKRMVYKPVQGGGEARLATPADVSEEWLARVRYLPVQFQEFVEGTDILVFRVGRQLFASTVESDRLDFRHDPRKVFTPVELPDDVAADCHRLGDLLQQTFSLIDIRKTPDGEYVFLEANPSPKFLHIEAQTGQPITASLARFLVEGDR